MTDELENHTIRLLQEMRADQAAFRQEVMGAIQQLQIGQAALSADLKIVKGGVQDLKESLDIVEHDVGGIKSASRESRSTQDL